MTNHNGYLPHFKHFRYTCDRHVKKPYEILHNPRPLPLSEDLTKALEYLLWYVPNINSFQSRSNVLITELLYEDFSFRMISETLTLHDEDILFLDYIDDDIVDYYMESICTNCQKVILTLGEEETKVSSLVRHMRNAIAHGYFTVVDDRIIAFDVKHYPKKEKSYGCTAVIKLDPINLVRALRLLGEELTHEKLAQVAFTRCGYEILKTDEESQDLPFDFLMQKKGRVYAVEIKKIDFEGVAEPQHLDDILANFPADVDETKVLLMDSAVLDRRAKAALREHHIFLLDRDNLRSLMSGDDILERIRKHMNAE
ncbi:MAG: restriction endonuclease [Peptoniphilus sp.]|nr:restriction endonuclease [Peptoniphilus sp.]MDD7362690.1 restriction endonuclease [Bacillota bacterium]MDY6044911.1 restriction endonuclease [Peptoniphilus sp.]